MTLYRASGDRSNASVDKCFAGRSFPAHIASIAAVNVRGAVTDDMSVATLAPVMQIVGVPALGYLLTASGLINKQDAEVSFDYVCTHFCRYETGSAGL